MGKLNSILFRLSPLKYPVLTLNVRQWKCSLYGPSTAMYVRGISLKPESLSASYSRLEAVDVRQPLENMGISLLVCVIPHTFFTLLKTYTSVTNPFYSSKICFSILYFILFFYFFYYTGFKFCGFEFDLFLRF